MTISKIQLTRRWENRIHSRSSTAGWKGVYLVCEPVLWTKGQYWRGQAYAYGHRKAGPKRRSVAKARRDAERLAVELLIDIRDGVKVLMAKHGIDKDD